MSSETLRALLHAAPFRPFTVQIAEQPDIHVPHPGAEMVVNTEGDTLRFIDVRSISSISKKSDLETAA